MQKETYPTAISIGETKNGTSGETEAIAEGQEKKADAEREQLEEAFCQKISRELEHSVWSGIKEICQDAGKEVPEEAAEKKNQKYPKPKEGRGEREEKPLGIHGGQKIGKKSGTQAMQKKRASGKNQGTQGKERLYGKADSDQKPAA